MPSADTAMLPPSAAVERHDLDAELSVEALPELAPVPVRSLFPR